MNVCEKYKFLAWILIAGFFISNYGCKKYPDGPLLSLHTKTHRVCGEWDVEYFEINGYDSTTYFKNHPLYGYYTFKKEKEEHRFSYKTYGYNTSDTNLYYSAFGDWGFDNFKKDLSLTADNINRPWRNFNLVIFNEEKTQEVQIRRLTEVEMWLQTLSSDGRTFFVKLKPKNN